MTYGNFITNIHLKDRIYLDGTVPLGLGDANFDLFFEAISQMGYRGDFIIQGAREQINKIEEPEQTCKKYRNFVKTYVDKYYKAFNIS
jgi:sugar phosphate isomerase/epimerase